jgi:hypothetical protein
MKTQISITEKTELLRVAANQFPKLSTSEFELAFRKASERNDELDMSMRIDEEIEAHRQQFTQGATHMSEAGWNAAYKEADTAARAELLKTSAILSELSALEKRAVEAKQAAEAADRQLQALWSEFQGLPARATALIDRLTGIANARAELDSVETTFKATYRQILDGAIADPFALSFQASMITTANLRREVLSGLESELQDELKKLNERNAKVAKQLSQPKHSF